MSETLFSLLMIIAGVVSFGLGWHLRGVRDRPPFTTKPPTSNVIRRSHQIDVAPYKIPPPVERGNLLEPINLQAVNKRNRERSLANMRARKRNN